MEILSLLWNVLGFVLGLVWQVAWFILRDLISTALWVLIVAWLILGVRNRSFTAGAIALLRYGAFGLRLFWRWLRGAPGVLPPPPPQPVRVRRRRAFGTMSISEQLNMLLAGAIYLLFFT